jgi:hypothetical protein
MTRLWDDDQGPFWDDDSAVWDEEEKPAMNNDRRNYKFADSLLYSESGLLISACGTYPAVAARLPTGFVAATVNARTMAITASAGGGANSAGLKALTDAQNAALKNADSLASIARDIASKTPQFKANPTLLTEQFRVGDKRAHFAGVLDRVNKIHAACTDTANAAILESRGWKSTDSDELQAAILAATGADTIQEARKITNQGDTSGFIGLNNDLYDRCITIQGAARLEFRDGSTESTTALGIFRDGLFPPVRNENVPTIPKKFIAKPGEPGSLRLDLDWNISSRQGDYVVTAKNKATGEVLQTLTTTDNKGSITFPGVTPGTGIELTIIARNDAGSSKPAGPITANVP